MFFFPPPLANPPASPSIDETESQSFQSAPPRLHFERSREPRARAETGERAGAGTDEHPSAHGDKNTSRARFHLANDEQPRRERKREDSHLEQQHGADREFRVMEFPL